MLGNDRKGNGFYTELQIETRENGQPVIFRDCSSHDAWSHIEKISGHYSRKKPLAAKIDSLVN